MLVDFFQSHTSKGRVISDVGICDRRRPVDMIVAVLPVRTQAWSSWGVLAVQFEIQVVHLSTSISEFAVQLHERETTGKYR